MLSPVDHERPFPLYSARLIDAVEYAYAGFCSLCNQAVTDRIRLGLGADLIYRCLNCGRDTAVPADDHVSIDECVLGHQMRQPRPDSGRCHHCAAPVPLIILPREPAVCVTCLAAGRAALTKGTEHGTVRWIDTLAGQPGGNPALTELVFTPAYPTWRGERWLFCCDRAMVFIGEWTHQDVREHAPKDPHGAFRRVFPGASPQLWEAMPRVRGQGSAAGFYAFRCRDCGNVRGHFDTV